MQSAIPGFLQFLKIERNCSSLTIKSYSEDLQSILEYFRDFAGGIPAVGDVTIASLRGYVAYLHECEYSRSTMARRLACLRSFFRYCCREQLTATNPAKALRTPRAGRRLPHFLSTEQVAQLLEAPPANQPLNSWKRIFSPFPKIGVLPCRKRLPAWKKTGRSREMPP